MAMLSWPIAAAAAAAFGKHATNTRARSDQLDGSQQRVAAAETPRLVQPSAIDAFHREGDRSASADRIEAELVAAPGRAQCDVGIADAAERTEREQAFVFDANAVVRVLLKADTTWTVALVRLKADTPWTNE